MKGYFEVQPNDLMAQVKVQFVKWSLYHKLSKRIEMHFSVKHNKPKPSKMENILQFKIGYRILNFKLILQKWSNAKETIFQCFQKVFIQFIWVYQKQDKMNLHFCTKDANITQFGIHLSWLYSSDYFAWSESFQRNTFAVTIIYISYMHILLHFKSKCSQFYCLSFSCWME